MNTVDAPSKNLKRYLFSINAFRVVGPQCVITCFMENESVPNNKSPVFTMAMRNLIITLSAFSLAEKVSQKECHCGVQVKVTFVFLLF